MECRQSNFELLRIVAMVFIILCHIALYGGLRNGVFYPEQMTVNILALQSLVPLGGLGVNLFILISGYFLYSSNKSTWPKIFKLWIEMEFFSIVLSLAFAWGDGLYFTPRDKLDVLIPFLGNRWWFASCYLLMLGLSPFLNKLIEGCKEKDHLKLIIGALVMWMLIPSFTGIRMQYTELGWFIVIYLIGAYIAKYPIHFNGTARRYFLYSIAGYAVFIGVLYLIQEKDYHSLFWGIYNVAELETLKHCIFVAPISIALFLAFSKMELPHSKVINAVASTTFGIYLIHEFTFVRQYIYTRFFNVPGWTDSNFLILYVFLVCAVIFTVCALEEYVRKRTLGRYIDEPLSRRVGTLQMILNEKLTTWLSRKESESGNRER